ncbi:MAG TPA: hypothetical protein VHL31_10235 [Geminicoccus sp.]|nr:hypothetical protein [Geminicoccus sp.]HEX2526658.1 hypothetical protein [Geminicoccus sp.]
MMRTDMAELGHVPSGSDWPSPGQASPPNWPIYEAALRWCRSFRY